MTLELLLHQSYEYYLNHLKEITNNYTRSEVQISVQNYIIQLDTQNSLIYATTLEEEIREFFKSLSLQLFRCPNIEKSNNNLQILKLIFKNLLLNILELNRGKEASFFWNGDLIEQISKKTITLVEYDYYISTKFDIF